MTGVRRLTRSVVVRAVLFVLPSRLIIAPATIVSLGALQVREMSFVQFLIFKSLFAGLLGGIVCPIAAAWALNDIPEPTQPRGT
jgi:hypothetical protein